MAIHIRGFRGLFSVDADGTEGVILALFVGAILVVLIFF